MSKKILIIGLGNPGKQYENNRHNVGYFVVDELKSQMSRRRQSGYGASATKVKDIIFVKTNVFMNDSGKAVKKLTTDYRLLTTDLYIIHDDLDIPLGKFKIQKGRGPKDHNGVNNVEDVLGTNDFWRIRIGVDNRDPENRISGEEYTLQDFSPKERSIIDGVIKEIVRWLISQN